MTPGLLPLHHGLVLECHAGGLLPATWCGGTSGEGTGQHLPGPHSPPAPKCPCRTPCLRCAPVRPASHVPLPIPRLSYTPIRPHASTPPLPYAPILPVCPYGCRSSLFRVENNCQRYFFEFLRQNCDTSPKNMYLNSQIDFLVLHGLKLYSRSVMCT